MKKIFQFLSLAILVVLTIVLVQTFAAKNYQPSAYTHNLPDVSPDVFTHLSTAVQTKTISHKIGMMDTAAFNRLHRFILETYPQFHAVAEVETLSTHTLLYQWKGSQPQLKPQLYMGHLDVVPVERATLNKWTHPPFSGIIDDEFIWGRGTLDDKGTVIGLLESVEALVKLGFKPKHTLYFLFGQDEEILGQQGAVIAAQKFKKENIRFSFVWDEGTVIGKGLVPGIDNEVALIGVSEKGYVSFELTAELTGGHSSMPNPENAIGDLAKAISDLQANPFPYEICEPVEGFLKFMGPVSPFVNRMAFANPWLFKPVIFNAYAKKGSGRASIQTTMAPTIFKAGMKDNVIPNQAKATVNCRILPGHTIADVENHLREVINNKNITLKTLPGGQNPGTVADFSTASFTTLCKTIKTVYPNAYATPFLMLGATDSRHFVDVADNIYKFAPYVYEQEDLARLHGINERISKENFKKGIQIYTLAIQKLDEIEE